MKGNDEIIILGGGAAGAGAAYYANLNGLDYRLIEAKDQLGGNCNTIESDGFLFDTGAHRIHDKFPDITQDFYDILGDKLRVADVPSQIYSAGKWIDFPISPANLIKSMSLSSIFKTAKSYLARKKVVEIHSFEDKAIRQYGRHIAEKYILNYSKKLWGIPPSSLLPDVSGGRLKGLDFKTFFIESLQGNKKKTAHLDGTFLYPKGGIGELFRSLESTLDPSKVLLNSKVDRLNHDGHAIQSVSFGDKEIRITKNAIINTLPLSLLVRLLDPLPPAEIIDLAESLQFRHVLLVHLKLNMPVWKGNATNYFPEDGFPFARIVEPKMRSEVMTPNDKTSLVAEIPFFELENLGPRVEVLKNETLKLLRSKSMLEEGQLLAAETYVVPYAYPVLSLSSGKALQGINNYLSNFSNLKLLGRSAEFKYSHVHNHFQKAKSLISQLI